jgi:MFS family permease
MPFGIASAVSPIIYGLVRDRTGSYDAMLWAAMGMFIVGGSILLLLGRYPDWTGADAPAAAPEPLAAE